MRILVTGSSGFLGRHLVGALVERRHEVLGLDRSVGETETPIRSAFCDLLDAPSLIERFSEFRPDALVHLAARTDLGGRSLEEYSANTRGVSHLLSAIRRTASLRRAIFTSSQLVCRLGYVPRGATDYLPSTLYGESKVRTEQIVREGEGGGVTWCLVRPTTVWGPGMNAHYQRFLRLITRGLYFHIGQKPIWKTYGYVRNVVQEYLVLLEAEPDLIHGKTLYVGDYEPLSLRVWADGLSRALGAPPIRSMPRSLARGLAIAGDALNVVGWKAFPFNSFRLANVLTESVYDMSAVEAICGGLPCSMEMGIEETAHWFRSLPKSTAGRCAGAN